MNKISISEYKCNVCSSTKVETLLELNQVPVHVGTLWPDRDQAINAPRGDILLGFCGQCGHFSNLQFMPELMEYSREYDNSLHYSPKFQSYAEALARGLIKKYDLFGKKVIEIGCGKGDFLRLLCDIGNNQGIGFDPSIEPDLIDGSGHSKIEFIKDYYTERYANIESDMICSRHVLEHIDRPGDFLTALHRTIGENRKTLAFFEVPNFHYTLRENAIWDLIYEHCSYFTPQSLKYLFEQSRFEVLSIAETFGDQYLTIEARPTDNDLRFDSKIGNDKFTILEHKLHSFVEDHHRKVQYWQDRFEQIKMQKKKTVIWGIGAKGICFLNMLAPYTDIEYGVDINPRKRGMYVAGTGQQIVPPEYLRDYQPDIIIVMNPIYHDEIVSTVKSFGLDVEFMVA